MNSSRAIPLSWPLLAAALAAQPPAPAPAAAEARRLLDRHAERAAAMTAFRAPFVQRRHSALALEPLVSSGELRCRREPPVLWFATREPRRSDTRLTPTTYEVYRPDAGQLERFAVPDPELPAALFRALSPRAPALLETFTVEAVRPAGADGALREVRLQPTDPKTRRVLTALALTFTADGALRAMAWSDPDGDRVELELGAIDADHPPADAELELRVPPDTRVIQHRPPPAGR